MVTFFCQTSCLLSMMWRGCGISGPKESEQQIRFLGRKAELTDKGSLRLLNDSLVLSPRTTQSCVGFELNHMLRQVQQLGWLLLIGRAVQLQLSALHKVSNNKYHFCHFCRVEGTHPH